MNQGLGKGLATCGIWLGLALLVGQVEAMEFIGYLLLSVMGMIATGIVWSKQDGQASEPNHVSAVKAKRQPNGQVAMLLDLLDDEERKAFKAALMKRMLDQNAPYDDGELPGDEFSLMELLGEQASSSR